MTVEILKIVRSTLDEHAPGVSYDRVRELMQSGKFAAALYVTVEKEDPDLAAMIKSGEKDLNKFNRLVKVFRLYKKVEQDPQLAEFISAYRENKRVRRIRLSKMGTAMKIILYERRKR